MLVIFTMLLKEMEGSYRLGVSNQLLGLGDKVLSQKAVGAIEEVANDLDIVRSKEARGGVHQTANVELAERVQQGRDLSEERAEVDLAQGVAGCEDDAAGRVGKGRLEQVGEPCHDRVHVVEEVGGEEGLELLEQVQEAAEGIAQVQCVLSGGERELGKLSKLVARQQIVNGGIVVWR